MLYLLIFTILFIFTIQEVVRRKPNKKVFNFLYIVLTLFLVLRQGQGTDYYNYRAYYDAISYFLDVSFLSAFSVAEPGYVLLNIVAIKLGIPYTIFASLFSLITMLVLYRFFYKHCNQSIAALFVFFVIGYLTYCFNLIRQGLALAIILHVVPDCFETGKWKKFYLSVLFAAMFHSAVLVCAIIPFVCKKRIKNNVVLIIIIVSCLLSFVGPAILLRIVPPIFSNKIAYYVDEGYTSTRFFALAIRVIDIFPILLINSKIYSKDLKLKYLRNILLTGFILYALFSFNDLVASRINYMFRAFEAMFYALIIRNMHLKHARINVSIVYVMLTMVLYFSGIKAAINQASYTNCNVLTYPYFSVFDTEEKISNYREI